MNIIAIVVFTIIVIPYLTYYFRRNYITPVSAFLAFQIIMFYGICFSSQGNTQSAHKLQYIYCVALFFYILGVEFSKRVSFRRHTYFERNSFIQQDIEHSLVDHETSQMQKMIIWSIIIVSIALCGLLFARSGGNLFVQTLRNLQSSDDSYVTEARKDYVDVNGIGYIYQFRVVLLPVLASYVLFFEEKRVTKLVTVPVYILMILFILGTGQRNAFVYYCVFILFYILLMKKIFNMQMIKKKQLIALGIIAILFLVLLTISNGRVSGNNKLLGAIQSLFNRVFFVNQESAIVGFDYMDSQGTVWGYDWWKMFEQLLPGKSDYIPIDYISYRIVYGTLRGTNPPCLWGSAWYNFYIFGVSIFPFILGCLYEKLHKTMVRFQNKDRLYMLIYAGLCTYLGVWTSGTPMALFNNGVVTLLILRWLCFKFFPRRATIKHMREYGNSCSIDEHTHEQTHNGT